MLYDLKAVSAWLSGQRVSRMQQIELRVLLTKEGEVV